jgi:enamine deaminase RidA (YjgF/YER057c/UK114 family)
MSYFSIIVKFLPELIALVKYLSKKIEEGVSEAQLRSALKQFDSALDKAIATKDTSDLEDIFRGKP